MLFIDIRINKATFYIIIINYKDDKAVIKRFDLNTFQIVKERKSHQLAFQHFVDVNIKINIICI